MGKLAFLKKLDPACAPLEARCGGYGGHVSYCIASWGTGLEDRLSSSKSALGSAMGGGDTA